MTAFTLFHTSPTHVARFDTLRDRIAPGTPLAHVVRADWLARAQGGIDAALREEILTDISAAAGRALCTCTTIGAVAEDAGALRIDRPVMAQAAQAGGRLALAYCLESTAAPSRALLAEALAAAPGREYLEQDEAEIGMLDLTACWPLFEAGDGPGFETAVAEAVRAHLAGRPDIGAVVLAQASMAGAAGHLADLAVPVLSSPEPALRALLSPGAGA